MPSLSERLIAARQSYVTSAYSLDLFVDESLKSLAAAAERSAEILRKISVDPADDGQIDLVIADSDADEATRTLKLSTEEHAVLREAIDHAHAAHVSHPEVLFQ